MGAAVLDPAPAPLAASFRDPSGYVFRRDSDGRVCRRVLPPYVPDYRLLTGSGLYDELAAEGLLIPHTEDGPVTEADGGVLLPEPLDFVSYPYEWCFGQLKDAALLTLDVQRRALGRGMSLKDASAYNVQFHRGRPVFIDTLSFEAYREGEPWPAYRQFCEHFLAPLALMAHVDVRLGPDLLRAHLDGVPLPLAARLLPLKARLNPLLYGHVHVQARLQEGGGHEEAKPGAAPVQPRLDKRGLLAILDSLESVVRGLRWEPAGTVWGDYYDGGTNYSEAAMTAKQSLVASFLERAGRPATVWDLGANDGRFARLAALQGAFAVAWDIDPAAVEKAYREVRRLGETRLLPLLQDLTNPSPGQGWALSERASLGERGPAGCVLALALVHHLALANNVPLGRVSSFLASLADPWLVIEFVPKEDGQAKRLLANRRDIFPDYHREGFEAAFARDWRVERCEEIPGTLRHLYLMRRRGAAE
jgi:ribosomal protein L11 methylase PrmA